MWNGEIYQNYPRLDEPDYGARYWADAQGPLYAVKRKYDPSHSFTFAQEIVPPAPRAISLSPSAAQPAWLRQALDAPIVYA
jgi:hypothetical protein